MNATPCTPTRPVPRPHDLLLESVRMELNPIESLESHLFFWNHNNNLTSLTDTNRQTELNSSLNSTELNTRLKPTSWQPIDQLID